MTSAKRVGRLAAGAACAAAAAVGGSASEPFASGADASWYTQMVHDAGYVFRSQGGVPEPCLSVLQGTGINALRLRVWLNPAGGWCNQADVVAKAMAAHALGQRVLLDFHFSDTWASGSTQTPPAAWQGFDLAQLETAVAAEVTGVLTAIQQAGGSVSWVQLGNEINSGMLFPIGEVGASGANSFPNLAALINAGYAAVKAVFPLAQVVIHLSNGENTSTFEWFFDNLKAAGGRFDVIGMSAYPYWANLPWQTEVTEAAQTLGDMQSRYGVPTLVCECGYAESDPADSYSFLMALIAAARKAGALGVFYWEPECYGAWPPGGAYALGAFTSEGEPNAGLNAFVDSGVAPYFAPQPASVTIAAGASVLLGGPASGFPAPAYQWTLNGAPLAGATGTQLLVRGVASANAGAYVRTATNAFGSATSSVSLSVAETAAPGRLINLSTRAQVGTGANLLIAGFVVGGAGTGGAEPLLVRGSGPALTPFGVAGVLADPQLTLQGPSGVIATNDGWGGSAAIAAAAAAVGAFAWSDAASHDAALLESLSAGAYTAEIAGQSGDTGVALAEVYDAAPSGEGSPGAPRLINLSIRGQVGTGPDILIAGFVIGGTTSKTVLIRATGPTLAQFGVSGVLPDPELQLEGAGGGIAGDTGWGGNGLIASVAASVGAFTWSDPTSLDSALLVTLPPGPYTAEVSGAGGDTGVALIEVYDVP
jgi:arabinogalactan endo-1,4-beta-galactosidase